MCAKYASHLTSMHRTVLLCHRSVCTNWRQTQAACVRVHYVLQHFHTLNTVSSVAWPGAYTILWMHSYLAGQQVCSDDQWSFFSLSSSSWFRLTSLGLPSTWVGHKYAVMRHGGLNDLVQPPPGTEAVNSTLHQQQDPIEVKRNIGGWDAANRMVERVLHLPFIHLSKDLKQQQQKP